ncbi:Zfp36l1 [Symbiodinium sp. CCMP2456]|nr:Zfp36l1 [Symbiodinium sp. CCMP2456]
MKWRTGKSRREGKVHSATFASPRTSNLFQVAQNLEAAVNSQVPIPQEFLATVHLWMKSRAQTESGLSQMQLAQFIGASSFNNQVQANVQMLAQTPPAPASPPPPPPPPASPPPASPPLAGSPLPASPPLPMSAPASAPLPASPMFIPSPPLPTSPMYVESPLMDGARDLRRPAEPSQGPKGSKGPGDRRPAEPAKPPGTEARDSRRPAEPDLPPRRRHPLPPPPSSPFGSAAGSSSYLGSAHIAAPPSSANWSSTQASPLPSPPPPPPPPMSGSAGDSSSYLQSPGFGAARSTAWTATEATPRQPGDGTPTVDGGWTPQLYGASTPTVMPTDSVPTVTQTATHTATQTSAATATLQSTEATTATLPGTNSVPTERDNLPVEAQDAEAPTKEPYSWSLSQGAQRRLHAMAASHVTTVDRKAGPLLRGVYVVRPSFGSCAALAKLLLACWLLKCQFGLLALWFLVSSAQKMWSNSSRTEVEQESLDTEPVPGSESGHLLVANAAPCGPRGKWAPSYSTEPTEFDSGICHGSWLCIHKPTADAERMKAGDYPFADHLHTRKRLWEFRLQLKFRESVPAGNVFFGCEQDRYYHVGTIERYISSSVIALLRKASGDAMYQTHGDDPKYVQGEAERPTIAFPLWVMDQLIITEEGDDPPALNDPDFSSYGTVRALDRKRMQEVMQGLDFQPGRTFTFGFWCIAQFVDAVGWRVPARGVIPEVKLNEIGTHPPIYITMYLLSNRDEWNVQGTRDERHLDSRKIYIWRVAAWSSPCLREPRVFDEPCLCETSGLLPPTPKRQKEKSKWSKPGDT